MKTTIITIIFALGTYVGYSQPALSLEQCRQIAISSSPLLKQSEQQVGAAEYAVQAARKDYFPQIDISGDLSYSVNPMTITVDDNNFEGINTQYAINAALIQNIYSGGLVRKSHELSGHQLSLTENNKATMEDVVLYQTELYFWNTIYMKEKYKLSILNKEVIDNLVDVVRNKVEGEVVNRSDLLLAEVRQNEAKLSEMKASDNLEIARLEVKRVMGIPIDSLIELSADLGQLSDYSDNKSMNEILGKRPEMASQEVLINIRETQVGLAEAQYSPSVFAGIIPVWGAPNYKLPGDDPNFNAAFMAGVSMPVIRWGKKRDEINQRLLLKEAEQYQLEELVNQISLEVKSAKFQLDEAVGRINLTTESLKKAEENLEMMTDRYTEGLSSILEVLDAQLYWQTAFLNILDAEAYYQSSLTTYKKAAGDI
jgi:outer membrane protein